MRELVVALVLACLLHFGCAISMLTWQWWAIVLLFWGYPLFTRR